MAAKSSQPAQRKKTDIRGVLADFGAGCSSGASPSAVRPQSGASHAKPDARTPADGPRSAPPHGTTETRPVHPDRGAQLSHLARGLAWNHTPSGRVEHRHLALHRPDRARHGPSQRGLHPPSGPDGRREPVCGPHLLHSSGPRQPRGHRRAARVREGGSGPAQNGPPHPGVRHDRQRLRVHPSRVHAALRARVLHPACVRGEPARGGRGGLRFPYTAKPTFVDFAYYAFVIGCACQTADVETTSAPMRTVTVIHGVLSFFFNTAVLALTINIASGLV